MVQVGAAVAGTSRAGAGFVQRARIIHMAGVLDVDLTAVRPRLPGAAGAAWQHAIHHVNAAHHSAHNIIGFADAHQVAGFVLRQHARRVIQHAEHRLLPLAHRKAANGVAVKADLGQRFGRFLAQGLRHPALHDPKQRMAGAVAKGIA